MRNKTKIIFSLPGGRYSLIAVTIKGIKACGTDAAQSSELVVPSAKLPESVEGSNSFPK